ncbi:MAG: TlpA family protein disulfide reductase [Magnetococcales bacterium]|nr:TlpA family protein disulfide reductase [Magnetococcales bacterium]
MRRNSLQRWWKILFGRPFFLTLLCLVWSAPATWAEPPKGRDAPLETVDGKNLRLADYQGKVVVINFWATWCPPCLSEIPTLIQFQEKYRQQGLAIIGVDFMDRVDRETLGGFVARRGINYPIIFGDPRKTQELARYLGGVMGLPTTKFLDRQGNVVRSHTGELQPERLKLWIEPLLASPF